MLMSIDRLLLQWKTGRGCDVLLFWQNFHPFSFKIEMKHRVPPGIWLLLPLVSKSVAVTVPQLL